MKVQPNDYIAAVLKLAERNIPPDIQELLVTGNPDKGIRPGALLAAIQAAFDHAERENAKTTA
jgi:hypothetical protein